MQIYRISGLTALFIALGVAPMWISCGVAAQELPKPQGIFDRAQELHDRNPVFSIQFVSPGPFQFGERIYVSTNGSELSKKLYPPGSDNEPFEIRKRREDALHFQLDGLLLDGPVSCGDFVVPCANASFQRDILLHGQPMWVSHHTGDGLLNLRVPPLIPGKYKVAFLVYLFDEVRVSTLPPEALRHRDPEEYLVSNILEFEVLPLNQRWVDAQLESLSAITPPDRGQHTARDAWTSRRGPSLSPHEPLGAMLFLPTEAALSTAYEFYLKTNFDPVLATFYLHPDPKLACRFLLAQIGESAYPVIPKVVEQAPHICVDAEHHFQQTRNAGRRSGSGAYQAAMRLRYDDYDRFRLEIARNLLLRFKSDPTNEDALRGILVPLASIYNPLASIYNKETSSTFVETSLREIHQEIETHFSGFSLDTRDRLLRAPHYLPEAAVQRKSLEVLQEPWPQSGCIDTSVSRLRRTALRNLAQANAPELKSIVEEMIQRLDPTLSSAEISLVPLPILIPPAILSAARDPLVSLSPCAEHTERNVILILDLSQKTRGELESELSNPVDGIRDAAAGVLVAQYPERLAEITLALVKERDPFGAELSATFVFERTIHQRPLPAAFDEIGLHLLSSADPDWQTTGARALMFGANDHKKLLLDRYRSLDRSLFLNQETGPSWQALELALRDALAYGTSWLMQANELQDLLALCGSEGCRRSSTQDIERATLPIKMRVQQPRAGLPATAIDFAHYTSLIEGETTLKLIRRYPRDTPIRILRESMPTNQSPMDVEASWLSKLNAEGFSDVEIASDPF